MKSNGNNLRQAYVKTMKGGMKEHTNKLRNCNE
jgi:uncharacterized protein YnzC (UPF0291/DUF896 family)